MTASTLLELPNPFATEYGSIKLVGEAGCDCEALLARLKSGEHDRPFVIDDGDARSLYFSLSLVQSVMRLNAPDALELGYTRKMMGFLLFLARPRHILLFGLGGGSLLKYCRRHLPLTRLTAVEVCPDILAFRELFHIPPDDARLQILLGDAADYIASSKERPDVIMMDAFDRHGFSRSTANQVFYDRVREVLAGSGVLVANLAGDKDERTAHLAMLGEAFDDNLIVVPVRDGGNQVVFAFRDCHFQPRWKWIDSQARELDKRYRLDFAAFANKLERGYKRGASSR